MLEVGRAQLAALAKTKTNQKFAPAARVGAHEKSHRTRKRWLFRFNVVEHIGLEPMASSMPLRRSSQLS